jgi:hypothetical protein
MLIDWLAGAFLHNCLMFLCVCLDTLPYLLVNCRLSSFLTTNLLISTPLIFSSSQHMKCSLENSRLAHLKLMRPQLSDTCSTQFNTRPPIQVIKKSHCKKNRQHTTTNKVQKRGFSFLACSTKRQASWSCTGVAGSLLGCKHHLMEGAWCWLQCGAR